MKRIKVMVVDDSLPFARAVAQFLSCSGSFEVLASAHSGGEALARAGTERPDLMLIDISMPGMSGLAVASSIKALQGNQPVTKTEANDIQADEKKQGKKVDDEKKAGSASRGRKEAAPAYALRHEHAAARHRESRVVRQNSVRA